MPTISLPRILPGSAQSAVPGARALGPVDGTLPLEITLRLRAAVTDANDDAAARGDQLPRQRVYLSRSQCAQAHGASEADIVRVREFAASKGLHMLSSSVAQRRVVLSGTAQQMAQLFGAQLQQYQTGDGSFRGRTGELTVPAELADVVEGVFGLDDRPIATPRFRQRAAQNPAAGPFPVAYTPPQLAQMYQFPPGLDGSGQCIGLIELGGGSRAADLRAYFKSLGLKAPRVRSIAIDHGANRPGHDASADIEVMLDIEIAGALAPGAQIAVYFAPNSERGFLDAVTAAVHDDVHKPSIISISWGAPESAWTEQAMGAIEQVFGLAASMGVTILCAAGDNGATDGVADGDLHVDFPASAPHALACGGTRIAVYPDCELCEVVWNGGPALASGGGYSRYFSRPGYQATLAGTANFRGLPDVTGHADPASGYCIRVNGQEQIVGGTSAVAPLWAGLLARINQQLGYPVGFLHPLLYGALRGQGATRDVAQGTNGAMAAVPGWDAGSGWGSPVGGRLLQLLSA
ncbi:S8 family serine peptidase [Pseudoduganella sp. FT93W]|uniref:S8 family serine peptidase n=1 Tax=Duganella fentianensis TaxID=2692177 RepID=A0A845I113_9BURK|nr:S53 family peptidase [Duganella fentianensis]MYN45411.1 S8 family serine peptidase [Duganella fentianensis]